MAYSLIFDADALDFVVTDDSTCLIALAARTTDRVIFRVSFTSVRPSVCLSAWSAEIETTVTRPMSFKLLS